MLSRAVRYSLSKRSYTFAAKANRLDDWESFKMPGAPYADAGPLPPPPAKIDDKGKTRMTFLPESYFTEYGAKAGHCGPYMLFWGGLLTAISKEWIVLGPETAQAFGMAAFVGYFLIPNMAAPFVDREDTIQLEYRNSQVAAWKDYKISLVKSEIDGIERLKEQTSGLALIQEQRKNNLALALEAEHLNRQADLVEAVKKRLDYQVAVNNAEREAMTKHMINWIDREVQAAISKRSAKDDLNAAIAQLKSMAKSS